MSWDKKIDALLAARRKYLEKRPIASIVRSLGALSRRWLRRGDAFRRSALRALVGRSGFSPKAAEAALDAIFRELTAPRLARLLAAELGDPRVLDVFRRDRHSGHHRRAFGPRLVTHVFSANVPNPAILSFVLGMLAKSANIGKLSRRDAGFLEIYLDSLEKHDPKLAATNALLPPADEKALDTAFARSELVVAYGQSETIRAIGAKLPAGCRLAAYGPRTSFSVVMRSALSNRAVAGLARRTAEDIWMLDQRGCLSPSTVFVQTGGRIAPETFAAALRAELSKSGRWTVLFDEKPKLHFSLPAPILFVHSFRRLEQLEEALRPVSDRLQAASVEGSPAERAEAADRLAGIGVNRVCRAGRMQSPPVTWRHDGLPNFSGWLRWADRES